MSGLSRSEPVDPLPAFLDGLVNFSGIMIVRSLSTGRFLMVNPAFADFVGRPAEEIVGKTLDEIYHVAGDAEAIRKRDRDVLAGIVRPQFLTLHDAHGVERRFLAHKFPLFDPDGNRFAVGSVAMDVTPIWDDVQSSRAAHFETETRFRAVFDHAPIGQIFSDVQGQVTSVNTPMAAMLGYRPEEMVGRPVSDFASAAEFAKIRIATEQLLTGAARSTRAVRRFRHKSGHDVPVRVTSALLTDRTGKPRWWISMVDDMSGEERARAELEEAHEAALLAADRLRLLHSIATAANEAAGIDALAPRVLSNVRGHFGWPGGALLTWPDGAAPRVVAVSGEIEPPAAVRRPAANDQISIVGPGTVLVPVPAPDPAALLFRCDTGVPDENQREVLSLVASETARVIERETAAERVRESEERFRSVFDSSPLAMALTMNGSGRFGAVNAALCQLFGRSADELSRLGARDICHPDDGELADAAGAAAMAAPDGRHRFEMRFLHSSGSVLTTVVSLAYMQAPDGTSQLLAQIEDITARRTVEEVLRRQAEQDALTGLANRTLLGRMLCEMGAAARPCAILFIDLDGFKLINDTRGHDVGDEVLLEVAARLSAAVRPSDVVARFGGDEFVVVCQGASGDELGVARRVAERIEQLLRCPIRTQDGPAMVTASIGIAGGVIDPDFPQELLQRADAAMYQAKRLGKDRREIYDEHLHERAIEHQRTEAALRTALADGRFVVHYQPIVDLSDLSIVGFEALVRLVDEEGLLVSPDRFIAVAEQSGLIVPMGAWVLEESCRTIASLRKKTGQPFGIAVNIAARQAARADLASTVRTALQSADLPESALTLELTESALLEADETTLAQLVELRDSGVVIALDDFGTGYSSLTYLRRFPVSHLKVDRSFVSGMEHEPSDHAIVRAVTGLASELGLGWIAEGVETLAQRDLLAALGPGLAQGYLFSRPGTP